MTLRTRREFVKESVAGSLGVAASLMLGAVACRGRKEQGNEQVTARPLSEMSMQAAWVNDAEFTGYFVAMDKNWYTEEGLKLSYLPGGPDVIPEASLMSGRALVALTTPDTTINLILKEKAPLKIIGAQYQKSPLGIVSLKRNNVREPRDLINKTLAVPPVNLLSVEALLKLNGIQRERVKIVPYQYDPTPLIKGEVDATVDFTTNVPFSIKLAGAEPWSFLMYDFGLTIYNDTVVVQDEVLRTRRTDLIKWLRASRRGWEENLKNPALYPPRFGHTHFKGNGRSVENEVYFNTEQKRLIESPHGMFAMTEDGIKKNIRALHAIGLDASREMFVTDLASEL